MLKSLVKGIQKSIRKGTTTVYPNERKAPDLSFACLA